MALSLNNIGKIALVALAAYAVANRVPAARQIING